MTAEPSKWAMEKVNKWCGQGMCVCEISCYDCPHCAELAIALDAAREMGRADIEPVLDKVAIPILEAKNAEIVRLKAKLDDSVTVKDHLEACDLARGQGRWEALRGALEACANLVSALSCCERLRELIAAEEKEDSITASADFIERNVGVCGIKPEFSRLKTALGGLQVGAREATDGVVAWQGEAMTAAPSKWASHNREIALVLEEKDAEIARLKEQVAKSNRDGFHEGMMMASGVCYDVEREPAIGSVKAAEQACVLCGDRIRAALAATEKKK